MRIAAGYLMLGAAMAAPFALAAAGPGAVTEPHLSIVPRSAEEAARVAAITALPVAFDAPEPFEANPGGDGTVRARADSDAFSQPQANLDFAQELDFRVGNGLFRKTWVSAPSSTLASGGLGPLFNAQGTSAATSRMGAAIRPTGATRSASSSARVFPQPAPGPAPRARRGPATDARAGARQRDARAAARPRLRPPDRRRLAALHPGRGAGLA